MPLITFSADFPIQKRQTRFSPMPGAAEFYHIICGGQQVAVDVRADETYALAEAKIEISHELYTWLQSCGISVKSYPGELANILATLDASARRVVEAIKFFLLRPDILDNAIGMVANFVWSENCGEQRPIPIPGEMTMNVLVVAGGGDHAAMQIGFDEGYRPLIGMRHLFRAMQEDEPRFRWIDTTIALELAIKEALIRKCPEIETLILEMPSPPLDKMYGSIMEKYLGEKSPYVKTIQEGVKIRNKLLHRPDGAHISTEDAAKYLHTSHKAINHVFRRIYPEWSVAKNLEWMAFKDSRRTG